MIHNDDPVPALSGAGIHAWIVRELASRRSLAMSMQRLIDGCEAALPHRDWARLRALPYARLSGMTRWLKQTFQGSRSHQPIISYPPAEQYRGMWFGMGNFSRNGKTVADISVCTCAQFEPDSPDAAWTGSGGICFDTAHSAILADIYRIAYRKGGLGNDAEYPLCLGYGAFAIRRVLEGIDASMILGKARSIGVAVGFTSGDFVVLGKFTRSGFARRARAAKGT